MLKFEDHLVLRLTRYRRASRRFMRSLWGSVLHAPVTTKSLLRLLSRRKSSPFVVGRVGSLQDLFDESRVFVINLEHRIDRRKDYEIEFKRLFGKRPCRFPAVNNSNGTLGCSLSHLNLLKSLGDSDPVAENAPVAVFEDDVEFLVSTAEIDVAFEAFLKDNRVDVLLICYHTQALLPKLPSGLRLVTNSYTCAGYIAKAQAIPALISVAADSVRQLSEGGCPDQFAIDVIWQKLQAKELIFVTGATRLARQRAGFSDIRGKFKSYGV